jgi:hypothetical protein
MWQSGVKDGEQAILAPVQGGDCTSLRIASGEVTAALRESGERELWPCEVCVLAQ